MLSVANTFFLFTFISSTISKSNRGMIVLNRKVTVARLVVTVYNAHELNQLYRDELSSRQPPNRKKGMLPSLSARLGLNGNPLYRDTLDPRGFSAVFIDEKAFTSDHSQNSGHTSGVGSSSTVLSSRDDVVFPAWVQWLIWCSLSHRDWLSHYSTRQMKKQGLTGLFVTFPLLQCNSHSTSSSLPGS